MLKHAAVFLCYACAAVAVLLFGPQWHPLIDQRAAIGLSLAVLLGGGLLHEVYARLGRETFLAQKLLSLRVTQGDALEELSWTRRELSVLREAFESVGGVSKSGKSVDEVIAEVKVLQSLITRLAKSSKAPKQAEEDALEQAARQRTFKGSQITQAKPKAKPHPLRPRPAATPSDQDDKTSALPANANQKPGVLPPVALGLDDSAILEVARQALRDDRIDLVLQPIVLLPQRKRRYYECFSRLRTSDGFMILPEQYIHLAEREGMVTAIDNMLLIRCVQLVRKVQKRNEEVDFFCNISSHTLSDDVFFDDFVSFLESNGELARNLVFEFPQSAYDSWDSSAAIYLRRLAELGCRFSLDGVLDLNIDAAALATRNFHFVKVRVEVLLAEPEMAERLLNDLKEQGLRLVAERVEDEDALVEVLDIGVDCAQGYLFGEPRLARPAA
ncbi:EAL domain-containing protein [Pelagibius litoralis]|uniref:EAL domain-containing protein n=1 Tax=Pelagibius litoralis TaxID=374515 RepID=A0A967F3C5_9PROT|nr:EAL domain-containing protein [Pelagibius litoralis]NIA72459.1 EAL domain-containing protein [Pelagibius litoralis]